MLEIPEAQVIAGQLQQTITGRIVQSVEPNHSPHKFAFFHGDPAAYNEMLAGKRVDAAAALAGQIELSVENINLVFSDGVNVRFYSPDEALPEKHQLRIGFSDGSSIVCSVQMYGGLWAFNSGENDNPYYLAAREKRNPLSEDFDSGYFQAVLEATKPSLSIKALLATEQRIPGLGNGVLQDILFNARINPRSKVATLEDSENQALFSSIKSTLQDMAAKGGRDTEKDLFGNSGGYATRMSSKTLEKPCPGCGGAIVRQAFMGGNVYFCPSCQPVKA
jgi:formamidopyrimidine-DNA glycosylase